MWTYKQSTGDMTGAGGQTFSGYSGSPEGKNDPSKQEIHNVGPIPQGNWKIVGPPAMTQAHGPYVLHLVPNGAETFGRGGFLIHGDSKDHPGAASEGCIILPLAAREAIWASNDRDLEVIA